MTGHMLVTVLALSLPAYAYADNDEEPDPPDDKPAAPKKPKKQADSEAKPDVKGAKVLTLSARGASDAVLVPPRVIYAGELLGVTPVDSGNRDLFGYGGGISLGAEVYVSPLIGVHGGGTFLFVGKDSGMSSTNWIAGHVGPRFHFADKIFGASTHHDAWADAHVAFGSSGGIKRPGFDVGAGIQWELSPALRVGPMLRYQFGADPNDLNAQLFTIGVAVGYGGRTRVATHVEVTDRDGDGIDDVADNCPDVAAGSRPDPERRGCPKAVDKPDADGDGVADEDDWCPKIPKGDNPHPKQPGCPMPQLARVVNNKIEILQQIFFETNLATLKSESVPVLESVAAILKSKPKLKVKIEGHTDSDGDPVYNLDLSKRRARSVAQWLIDSGGVDAARLTTEGYGMSRPLVAGENADQSKNRRVEFVILEGQ